MDSVKFGFSGANLNRKMLDAELLPEHSRLQVQFVNVN